MHAHVSIKRTECLEHAVCDPVGGGDKVVPGGGGVMGEVAAISILTCM